MPIIQDFMKEFTLLSPGPVPVPAFVMEAISKPVIHHRTEAFQEFYAGVLEGLKYLFQTDFTTGTMIGSGTYGVEAAMYSLFRPKEKVLVLDHGKFSNRWGVYGQLLGLEIIPLTQDWGKGFSPESVHKAIKDNPTISGIVITHSETSTGVCNDLEEIAYTAKALRPDLLILVDAITSAGTIPFYMDAWKIDAAIVASQKALMNPAGTIGFALSELAEKKLQKTDVSDFRNLYNYVQSAKNFYYPYTAPVQLLYGLGAALGFIQQKGLPYIWNQSHASAQTFRKGIAPLNGKVFAANPSDSLTAFYFPEIDNEWIRKDLIQKHGIHLAGGQNHLKGKIIRISHMGTSDSDLMERVVEKIAGAIKRFPKP